MNPNDPNQGGMGGGMPTDPNAGGMPAGDQPADQPAQDTSTPATGEEGPTGGAPAQEEKCSTCGGAASGGNCTMCAQPTASCTCPPAQAGGEVPAM